MIKSFFKSISDYKPQLAWTSFNGFRVPPRHLPEETRQAMIKAIGRGQMHSWRFWVSLLAMLGGIVPITFLSVFLFHKHPFSMQYLVCWFSTTFVILLAIEFLVVIYVIKPINVAIIAAIWREHQICSICDYDCRLSPDRCPECGTVR